MVHIIAVPQRFEDTVAKPQYHEVLDRILPQIVIYAVYLPFAECVENGLIQFFCRGQIAAIRFFDDDSSPGILVWIFRETRSIQLFDDDWIDFRRRCQVKETV